MSIQKVLPELQMRRVCGRTVLTSSLNDWYRSALKLEILDMCTCTTFSIAPDVVKSNSVALRNF